jgi:hypothetical protein
MPAIVQVRCNPFGRETGGPKRLLGGVYGPEYEGDHKWGCERVSSGRYRMECRCGHRGQPMELCGPGLTKDPQGIEYAHPGHVAEFSKRASDMCPVCLFPPEARMLQEIADTAQSELITLESISYIGSPQWRMLKRRVEEASTRLDELNASGRIHKCHLTLTEIS